MTWTGSTRTSARLIDRFLRAAKRRGAASGYIARPSKSLVGGRDLGRRRRSSRRIWRDGRLCSFATSARLGTSTSRMACTRGSRMTARTLERLARHLRETVTLGQGRMYAGGLTKFEPKEMERLPIPDLALLDVLMPIDPPRWTEAELEAARQTAIEAFRTERMQEPLEAYLETFDEYRGAVEDLLEATVNLTQLSEATEQVLTDPALLEAVRYLAGPPISADDLKVLADVESLAAGRLRNDPEMAQRVIDTVLLALDRRRFPWVAEDREPDEAEREAAALASAALMATSRVQTNRQERVEGTTGAGGGRSPRQRGLREGARATQRPDTRSCAGARPVLS